MIDSSGQGVLFDVPRCESSDERYTPTPLFQRLTAGVALELDVSATRESAKCARYYSLTERGEDGLDLPWAASAWNNPPWSDIEPWMTKARLEILIERRCPVLYQLLPSWTDRDWWHKYVEPYRDGKCLACGALLVGCRCVSGCYWRDHARAPSLSTRFLRRERFGRPGDPEGTHSGTSPDFWTVLLIWRPGA